MHLPHSLFLNWPKLPLSKTITKVNQFDSSLGCQEDVVAFDVTVDNSVVVQMLKTLLSWRTKKQKALRMNHHPIVRHLSSV